MDTTHLVSNTTSSPEIRDLPVDVLILIFSLLQGQDIARCSTVCRRFADLVRSELYLQYKIELAQNGMVDSGDSSTLPTSISERLHRIREYASRFRDGHLDYEDLAAHPQYVLQMRDGTARSRWNTRSPDEGSLSNLYGRDGRSDLSLSLFTPGSAQVGVPSSRCVLPIGTAGEPGLIIARRAIDGAQDLLVIAEAADGALPEGLRRRPDEVRLHIRFYSISGSKTTRATPHPAAVRPSVQILSGLAASGTGTNDVGAIQPMVKIVELHTAGPYVIWELAVTRGEFCRVFVEVCDWRAGEVIARIDVGTQLVDVVPFEYPYLLVLRRDFEADPHFHIYSFSPPTAISTTADRHICALRLPNEHIEDDEQIESHAIHTGDRPQTSAGHFRADLSRSMVVLQFFIEGLEGDREVHYLFPRTTFLAQIRAAEAQAASRQTPRANGSRARFVPWADWGKQGCLRLSLSRQHTIHRALVIPFGSRLPPLVVDESDFRRASVYVFDINPHVARYQRQALAARKENQIASEEPSSGTAGSTGIVQDIEAILPGVVDTDCSGIQYVAYRFELPCGPAEWKFGHMIGAVVMGMTGFTVKMAGVEYEKTEQSWTV